MITQNQILDAINKVTARLLPGMTTYREHWPQDYERPSLLLYIEKRQVIGGNRHLIELQQLCAVQITEELNDDGEADTDALSDKADRIADAFSIGYLRTGDRSLHIDTIETVAEGDIAKVLLTLHYMDDRPTPPETAETAAGVQITTDVKTHD